MHAVVEHIDRNPGDKLDLTTLAGIAHFSPFHFHRLFHALMGEPLGDYVRRRRLEVAAVRLRAQPAVPVLQIALGVGFGSAEAFTRAFRTRFGAAPTVYRKIDQVKRKRGKAAGKPGQAKDRLVREHENSIPKEIRMNVKLVDREPVQVAYLRHTGEYGPAIGKFWMNTVAPWMATNNLFGRERFGISLDDASVTKAEQLRYDACVASPEGEVLTGKPQHKVIPGGRYASLSFEGTSAEIPRAWDALLRNWLPKSGLQLDSRPFFEYYPVDGKYDPKTGRFTCDICVPVSPL